MNEDDPREYCIKCGALYRATNETCHVCDFDPVNNESDAEDQDEAERIWDMNQ